MYKYQIVEINNIEPLKIGAKGHQSKFEEPSKDYIPGSTIRGAIIGQLISLGKFKAAEKLILLSMECYNAYPCVENKLYIPTPMHLRMDKHGWRKAKHSEKGTLELNDLLKSNEADKEKEKWKNHLTYNYITLDQDKEDLNKDFLRGIKVEKEYRLHHSTIKKKTSTDTKDNSKENEEMENLFRYQAISAGQSFRTIIKYKKKLEKDIKYLFNNTSEIYLGGSKGSGYGRSKICALKSYDSYKEAKKELGINFNTDKNTKELVITCLSDCLFRNKHGQPCNHIPVEELARLGDIKGKIELKNQFVQAGQTEGYNTKWRARYPKEATVKAGSVLKYQLEADITEAMLDKLEKNLIGGRIQDGYGWIGVNIDFPAKIYIEPTRNVREPKAISREEFMQKINKSEKLNKSYNIILEGLGDARERWLTMLCNKLSDVSKNDEKYKLKISKSFNNSQLKNLEDMLDKLIKNKYKKIDLLKKDEIILNTGYANNKNQFSLCDLDFKDIWNYLNYEKSIEDKGYEELKEFVNNKLNTQKAKLFYSDEKAQKKFIIELLKSGLYMQRRCENEDSK